MQIRDAKLRPGGPALGLNSGPAGLLPGSIKPMLILKILGAGPNAGLDRRSAGSVPVPGFGFREFLASLVQINYSFINSKIWNGS